MNRNIPFGWSLLLVFSILLAACAPALTQTPAASISDAPVAPATVEKAVVTPEATATTAPSPTTDPTATAPSAAAEPTSTPATAKVVYVIDPAKSEASYSVTEQLAGRDLPNDAIGKTQNVTGQVTINPDGTIDASQSVFTVDLSTLQTDQAMRDNYVRRNILNTSQYPNAMFVPKQVNGIAPDIHQTGQVTFQMTGDLTIRDVTKAVTWEVNGTISEREATGVATTSFTFGDFNLNQPKVPVVLSVVDKITLTISVHLVLQGN